MIEMKNVLSPFSSILFVISISLLASVNVGVTQASQSEDPLSFELVTCGVGFAESSNIYKVSDGTYLGGTYSTHSSARKARSRFRKDRKKLSSVVDERVLRDSGGNEIGREVVGRIVEKEGFAYLVVLKHEGNIVTWIQAATLAHVRAFQDASRREAEAARRSPPN